MMVVSIRRQRLPSQSVLERWPLAHENHETGFMMVAFLPTRLSRRISPGSINDSRRIVMKWETPQATDFRFGMEITMYIANR
jgi:coenzyme PQQ precursor peptide PqqA